MQKLQQKKRETCCELILDYKKSKTSTQDYDADRAECPKCGKIWEQNLLTSAMYVCEEQGKFIHYMCGEEVDCVWRTHSLWDKRFECAGDGRVDRFPIPFCPKHEEKPSNQGMPIYY